MGGMLLGGFLWGILGDKRGRLSVLFGSIALYSVANFANAFVTTIPEYAAARFFAGLGLAGELGAAITLVSEIMRKETRGYGTAIVAAVGILGAVVGGFVAQITIIPGVAPWRVAYIVGGVLGFTLLVTRMTMSESLVFKQTAVAAVERGSLRMLLGNGARASRFVRTTLVGLPIWCIIAIFIGQGPFIAQDLGIRGPVSGTYAVMWFYGAASIGGLLWGVLSQRFASRKNVLILALTVTASGVFFYFFLTGLSAAGFYLVCAFLGFGSGYWSVFVTMAAEQFGTNLRATVATTVPNLIRGTTVPLLILYKDILVDRLHFGLARSAMILAAFCCIVALACVRSLRETHGADLDFIEDATPKRATSLVQEPVGA
jgi:MFS family permease